MLAPHEQVEEAPVMNPAEYAQQLYEQSDRSEERRRAFLAGLYDEAVLEKLDPDNDGWQDDTTPPPLVSREDWDAFMKLMSEVLPG